MPQEPYLSEEQQVALFHAVGRRIASIVTGTAGPKIFEQVSEIADIPLLGAFVSLKNNGQLRSCMGTMSDQIPLGNAVDQAAVHASKDDPRFPPLRSAELFELELEIWILWGMERVALRGKDRINSVEIGRHGVQISRGGNRGLLLPGVAVEYEMDAEQFLEAVCRKAGLPENAWLDDSSLLHRFEGRSIRGPFSATENIGQKAVKEMIFAAKFNRGFSSQLPGPSLAETMQLRDAALSMFIGMTEGLGITRYFTGLYDSNVSGVSLSFHLPDRKPLVVSKMSPRPDIPLQQAILELLKVLGQQLVRFGISKTELGEMVLNLTIFWDPAIHGNVTRNDLSSIETARRSVMLSGPQGWAVRFNPSQTAKVVLNELCESVVLEDPSLGEILSFETISTASDLTLFSVSPPKKTAEVRPAAVAGMFYPGDAKSVNKELDKIFTDAFPKGLDAVKKKHCKAVMVPHAGWRYSGKLTAQTLGQVAIPPAVIIFAPKHRRGGADWAVAPNRIWQLPGRTVESDLPLAEMLVQAVDMLEFDAEPHQEEHAIEVLLPFLSRIAPAAQIIGITMAYSSWGTIQQGATQFAAFLNMLNTEAEKSLGQKIELPLLLVSSDMNHFASDETGRKLDRIALDALNEAVKTKNPQHFLTTVLANQISMCGITPMTFVLETLRTLGELNSVSEIGYTTSAEETGDNARVVGYAGVLFE
jgi:AmmeMemoRadiSam system protein B/AmmeMemoRadiSam system protein A